MGSPGSWTASDESRAVGSMAGKDPLRVAGYIDGWATTASTFLFDDHHPTDNNLAVLRLDALHQVVSRRSASAPRGPGEDLTRVVTAVDPRRRGPDFSLLCRCAVVFLAGRRPRTEMLSAGPEGLGCI
jgi:hypothetical protein